MTVVDLEALLRRVVADVARDDVVATVAPDDPEGRYWSATLAASTGSIRTAVLLASYHWFEVRLPEHRVGAIVFDEDDDEAPKEAALRAVAAVARAWLDGEGVVVRTPRRFRRGEGVRVVVRTTDGEWVLGRRSSRVPYF